MRSLFFSSELVREMEYQGETLYSNRIVAPKWYWIYNAAKLFFGIVWRVWDSWIDENGREVDYRLSIRTSFEIVWNLNKNEIRYSKWICRYF